MKLKISRDPKVQINALFSTPIINVCISQNYWNDLVEAKREA